MKKIKCVWWQVDDECDGEIIEVEFFAKYLKVPICKNHIGQYKRIEALVKNGHDVEYILDNPDLWKNE